MTGKQEVESWPESAARKLRMPARFKVRSHSKGVPRLFLRFVMTPDYVAGVTPRGYPGCFCIQHQDFQFTNRMTRKPYIPTTSAQVYGIEAFCLDSGRRAAINSGRFFRSSQIVKQIARAFYRLFARYRYKLSGDKLVCGPECDHPMT
jgi:hypothetical protein